MTPAQNIARTRNWNKRIITGHMKALESTLNNNGLSKEEHEKIYNICNICQTILSDWQKTLIPSSRDKELEKLIDIRK